MKSSSGREPQYRSASRFWEVTLGGVFSGLSLFSLYVRSFDVGVFGIVVLIHGTYEWARDTLFRPLEWLLPFWQLSVVDKNALVLLLIVNAIAIRSLIQYGRVAEAVDKEPEISVVSSLLAFGAVITLSSVSVLVAVWGINLSLVAAAIVIGGAFAVLVRALYIRARNKAEYVRQMHEVVQRSRSIGEGQSQSIFHPEDDFVSRRFARYDASFGLLRLLGRAYVANTAACLFWFVALLVANTNA